jgi:hypothetical protein
MRFAIILLTIVATAGFGLSEPLDRPYPPRSMSKPPFLRIYIAVPERGGVVVRDDRSHFHIVIENISDRAQNIGDESGSWGYSTLHFEYLTPAGEKKVMEKLGREWAQNALTATTLQPGEVLVRDVYLDEAVWSNLPVPKNKGANINVRIHAIFAQKPEAGLVGWEGEIVSPEVNITFANLR